MTAIQLIPKLIFWLTFILIIFHYIGFNLCLILFSTVFKKKHQTLNIEDKNQLPTITFIVAAYNEEKIIEEKILNDLNLNYPKEKLQIIIVSDGTTDQTPSIVKKYQDQGVLSLHRDERRGKTAALNRAMIYAKNEIIVFSDANSMFQKDALLKLVRHFKDPVIGGVCGRKSVKTHQNRDASIGDNLYWKYESKIKQAESNLGSIPTADGEIFALRKSLFKPIPEFLINDDMAITFELISSGHRVIYDEEAITEEEASISLQDDFNVKARMIYGSLQILNYYGNDLNPLNSWFAFQFFIHKTLRYYMWRLLIIIFISNLLIIDNHLFYAIFISLQILFYLFAGLGFILNKYKIRTILFYLPYYYVNVNLAAIKGFQFFNEKKDTVNIWKKAER